MKIGEIVKGVPVPKTVRPRKYGLVYEQMTRLSEVGQSFTVTIDREGKKDPVKTLRASINRHVKGKYKPRSFTLRVEHENFEAVTVRIWKVK